MSSFFTVPGAQKKRKQAPTTADGPKKRFAATGKPSAKVNKAQPNAAPQKRRQERDDESISGSDSEDEDMADNEELEASGSDSERRAKPLPRRGYGSPRDI